MPTVQTELDEETHKRLKIMLLTKKEGANIKDYLAELIKEDLKREEQEIRV